MINKKLDIIKNAYSFLDDITPLKYDCGELCNSLCCKDNKEDEESLGMWLLPSEKELLEHEEGYIFTKAEDGTEVMTCSGRCRRHMRPFSCRIYPYYAYLSKENDGRTKISIRIDPRARLSCPIAHFNSHLRANIDFISHTKAAVRVLLKDEEISSELFAISDFLKEIEDMQLRIFKK